MVTEEGMLFSKRGSDIDYFTFQLYLWMESLEGLKPRSLKRQPLDKCWEKLAELSPYHICFLVHMGWLSSDLQKMHFKT